MQNVIINAYAIDSRNIGDLASSPTQYFDFKYPVETLDFRAIDPKFPKPKSGFGGSITLDQIQNTADRVRYHLILGGGGLVCQKFWGSFEAIKKLKSMFRGKWMAWGIGQQVYPSFSSSKGNLLEYLDSNCRTFDYSQYLQAFDHVGIRDAGFNYDWVPCASCMHPTFDKKREIKHDFVVYSHRKFQLKVEGFPVLTNEDQSLEEVIDFLGSGETILTSSYHGAYWGTLLGRKVIVFPFTTKFLTLKHLPSIYPVSQWKYSRINFKFRPFKTTFLNKIKLEFCYGEDKYTCRTNNWRSLLANCAIYPHILQECRDANVQFQGKTSELFADLT